jgi:hypothetical protein
MADEVTTETSPQTDRPVENLAHEVNRKFGALTQKLDALTGYLAEKEAQTQPKVEPPKGSHGSMSDDELWELAKTGDKAAFDAHQERKAAKVYQTMRGAENHQNLVEGQLTILQNKYPVLSNAQHPLTLTANSAYALLTRRGYQPNQATYLEAVKTAIADRPDLVVEMHTQGARAREGARRVSAGNSGVTGSTVRQDDPQADGKIRVTPEQSAIAKRMNIKDPAKAISNFIKRQETGESRFGAVASFVPQGEF